MIAALLAATLHLAPPVHVEVDDLVVPEAERQRFHGQLLSRLVEAGQAVGQSGTVHLRLAGKGRVVRVEVRHGDRVLAHTVEGEGAVLRLAAIHVSLELLRELAASEHAAELERRPGPERTVVVEAAAGAEALVPTTIRAAVGAGVVVAADAEQGRRLCVARGNDGTPRLGTSALGDRCTPERSVEALDAGVVAMLAEADEPPARASFSSESVEHRDLLGVSDEVSDLLEAIESVEHSDSLDASEVSDEPVGHAEGHKPGAARSSASEPRASRWRASIGLGAGAQARVRDAEALVLAEVAARHQRGPVVLLRGGFSPSRGGALRAYESFITAGAGWWFSVGARLSLRAGLMAGASVHAFSIHGDGGTRADFTAEIPLELALRLGRRLELGLAPVVGWTARGRRHVDAGGTLWSRDRFRVGGAVVVRVLLPAAGNSDPHRRP